MDGYDLPPYRPSQRGSFDPIRATRSCPWNRCAFYNILSSCKLGIIFEICTIDNIQPGTPLREMKEKGDFQPVDPMER